MKKLNLFLLVAGFFVFSSCTERLEHNEEKSSGNVVINLSSVNAERGAVPDGYSSVVISKVKEWTLTFSLVPPFNEFPPELRTIIKTIKDNNAGSFTIGVGQYDLFVEGSYTEQGVIYKLSGACSGIVVEEGNPKTVLVLVGPKKTTEGKGSFSAEMYFMQKELSTYYYDTIGLSPNDLTDKKSKRFKAELVSRKTGEIVYSTHPVDNVDKLLEAEADSKDTFITVKSAETESEPNKISSGYYYFHFYADFAPVNPDVPFAEITPVWKEVSIGDNLVEIGDGLSTSWPPLPYSDSEPKLLSFPDESTTYCYYASDKGSKDNNGISQDARGELYAVLDTIYNNPMVQNAVIDYSYTDSIRFDVSKIGSGKTVEIICNKDPQAGGDTPRFTLNKDSSVLFNMYAESITLFSTGKAKSVKIKKDSSSQFSLEDGVYLDLTSLTAEGLDSLSLRFCLDDNNVDYYKNNPVMVSSVSLGTVQGAYYRFSFYGDDSQFPSETYSYNKDAVFTYNMKEVPGSDTYNYFAEEPAYGSVVYYSNDSSRALYKIELENNNGVYADITYPDYENPDPAALASWCDDGNNGFYVFEIRDIQNPGTSNQKLPANPVYNVRHFEKIKKGTSFIFNQTKIDCNIVNIPVSMCTDGTDIYYVQSEANISSHGKEQFKLYEWGHWAYLDNKVKYFSVENPSAQNELDFSNVFKYGKVTAVYYYNNELYVAGYKKDYIGSVSGNQEQSAQEIKFYNCTYSVYKLSNPKDVTTAKLVSDVFDSSGEKARVPSILEPSYKISDDDRIIAYSAITDMAIVDGNLYVLENSYYKIAPTYGYGSRGSLRQVSLENGKVLKVLDENSNKEKVGLPYKIIAVLPKKLKISDNKKNDQSQNSTYDVDLSVSELSLEEKGSASGYYFDNYGAAGSSLTDSPTFATEGIYTVPSENDKKNNAFTSN